MKANTFEVRRRFRQWLNVVGLVVVAAPLFNYFVNEASLAALLRGLVDGAIIGALVGGYGIFLRDVWLRQYFRRMNFSTTVLVNAFAYLALFQLGRLLASLIHSPEYVAEFLTYFFDPLMLVAIPIFYVGAVVFEFILQMNLLVGHNVLWYFMSGTYHRPRVEERIFLFLDLQGSTTMAEQMGSSAYYALLEDFVNALTGPILESEGEIHSYVGDEVVITWKKEKGLRNANCIRCYFRIEEALTNLADTFQQRYDRIPRYRAGMHGGEVITGELGDIKRDIVFVGDVMNTAARLEEFAKKNDYRFIVSGAVVDAIEMPDTVESVYVTDHLPRGKETSIQLFEVRRRDEKTLSD